MNESDIEKRVQSLPKPCVIMGVGIPGSGKSTELSKLSENLEITRICPDEIRGELTGDQTDQTVDVDVWGETYRRANENLENGKSVIIDATNAELEYRRQAINLYKSFGAVAVAAIVFEVALSLAKERNSNRDRVVPEEIIDLMYNNLAENPAKTEDGFDEIIIADEK